MLDFIKSRIAIDYVALLVLFIIIFIIIKIIIKVYSHKENSPQLLDDLYKSIFPSLILAIVGLTVGILSGNSKIPVMSAVIPAILTFISGFIVYLFTSKKKYDNTVILCIIGFFSIFMIIGSWSGSMNKLIAENEDKAWQKELLQYNIDLELYKYKQEKLIDLQISKIKNNNK